MGWVEGVILTPLFSGIAHISPWLLIYSVRIFLENFSLMSAQVRPSDPTSLEDCDYTVTAVFDGSVRNFQETISVHICKSTPCFWWAKVKSVLWLSHNEVIVASKFEDNFPQIANMTFQDLWRPYYWPERKTHQIISKTAIEGDLTLFPHLYTSLEMLSWAVAHLVSQSGRRWPCSISFAIVVYTR